jgi:hypothetical protein
VHLMSTSLPFHCLPFENNEEDGCVVAY